MNVCVFDTETTSLVKPFCYNIGLVIGNTESGEILCKKEWVVEQIWHNEPLFSTAYYAEKRPIYVNRMRSRQVSLDKWGYIMQRMSRLFKEYEVSAIYAYNSPFDEKVFSFNCEWFKTQNPLELYPIFDIRGYVHKKLAWLKDFQKFCEENSFFTESGNYSTTAETVFRYLKKDIEFKEEHTALSDAVIEWEILKKCIELGAEWNKDYKVYSSIPRKQIKELELIHEDERYIFPYEKIRINKDKTKIILK